MTRLTSEMLKDLDKNTVNWDLNFDETLKEPVVLPSGIPTLLMFKDGAAVDQIVGAVPKTTLKERLDQIIS